MADAPEPFLEKIGGFVANIMQLERSVETLKEDNGKLHEQASRLQRQADDQAGQLGYYSSSFIHRFAIWWIHAQNERQKRCLNA
jgi:hypothetical protein